MKPVEPPGAHTERILKARIAELEAEVREQEKAIETYEHEARNDYLSSWGVARIAELEADRKLMVEHGGRLHKRVEKLEALLREARDHSTVVWPGLRDRIDAALNPEREG